MGQDWFHCEACGSPSVSLPDRLEADSPVRCSGCGRPLGSWSDYRRAVSSVILKDAQACRQRVIAADLLTD